MERGIDELINMLRRRVLAVDRLELDAPLANAFALTKKTDRRKDRQDCEQATGGAHSYRFGIRVVSEGWDFSSDRMG